MITYVFLAIALIYGLIKKKKITYWFYSYGAIISNFLAGFLFQAGGTLTNPKGDGVITAIVRQQVNDGPEVLYLFPIVIFLGYILPFILIRRIIKDQ